MIEDLKLAKLDERFLNVNSDGILKIPNEMWLAIAFLCRHWLLALGVGVSAGVGQSGALLIGGGFNWWVLTIEIPSLLFATVCWLRQPQAGSLVRGVWRYVVVLPVATIIMHIGYVVWYLMQSSYWLPWPELFLVSCSLIDLTIGFALIRSGYWRSVLAEFPAQPA